MLEPISATITTDMLRAAMHEKLNQKPNVLRNLAALVVSIYVFMLLFDGYFEVKTLVLIVIVLLIHESGHLLGMKAFGYRDVKMLFIPMLGAAVSGRETAPSSAKRAIVSLLGPVPGLFFGAGACFAYGVTKDPLWIEIAQLFLFINLFNLLPMYPLDGARVLEATVFSRAPLLETGFRALTGVALALLALAIGEIFLGVVSVLLLIAIPATHRHAKLAQKLRRTTTPGACRPDEIPEEQLEEILVATEPVFAKSQNTEQKLSLLADEALTVWERVCCRPTARLATVLLLSVYALSFLAGAFFVLITIVQSDFR